MYFWLKNNKMKGCLFILLTFLSFNFNYSQTGIGVLLPEASLDVEGNVKFRSIPKINIEEEKFYNKQLLINDKGDVGYYQINKSSDSYNFRETNSVIMTRYIESKVETVTNLDLNLKKDINIYPNQETLMIIDYNIPIIKITPGLIYYSGIKLVKRENNIEEELIDGSRKFTYSEKYSSEAAAGQPVTGRSILVIQNKTNQIKTITIEALGYIELNKGNSIIRFGMYSNNNSNYNWGRGNMIIQVFDKNI